MFLGHTWASVGYSNVNKLMKPILIFCKVLEFSGILIGRFRYFLQLCLKWYVTQLNEFVIRVEQSRQQLIKEKNTFSASVLLSGYRYFLRPSFDFSVLVVESDLKIDVVESDGF